MNAAPGRRKRQSASGAHVEAYPAASIKRVRRQKHGRVQGEELRAWEVRMPRGVCVYRVGEFSRRSGAVLSERGFVLGCDCERARICRGRCTHTLAVADRFGGRDVVAEKWEELDARAHAHPVQQK